MLKPDANASWSCGPIYLNTVITTSGHISAQKVQPVHEDISKTFATGYPALLISVLTVRIFLGQAMTHSPQPLHRSSLNSIKAIVIRLFFLGFMFQEQK
jgi:hypothetical protein